jgi:hypothetical protein
VGGNCHKVAYNRNPFWSRHIHSLNPLSNLWKFKLHHYPALRYDSI